MRCLSLIQPYATLVAIGAKPIDTRSWKTDYRGPLAIHASVGFPRDYRILCDLEPFHRVLEAAGIRSWRELPLGAVLCSCRLADCRPTSSADGLRDAEWLDELTEKEW